MCSLGTLKSDNGDANEKVTEKLTFRPFKLLRPYTKSPNYLKVGKLDWNWREGNAFEFEESWWNLSPLPFSSNVVVVQRRQRNLQKKRDARAELPFSLTYCFLLFSLPGRWGCLQGCLHGGRKILEGGTTFRWVTYRNFGPCGAQVKKELKTAGDKNKNAIWALLLLLALTTTFLQNYHNNQVLVTPNEIVGLLPSVTTKLPAAIFFLVCL